MNENLLSDQPEDTQIDPNKNYLEELVGEGKKFKDHETLARSKFESDSYIKILERRLDERANDYKTLKADYDSRASLQELIEQAKQQFTSSETPNANEEKPVIDSKQIESLVSSKILEHENTRRQTDNYNQVVSKLKERYGNSYQTALKQQMETLDLTESEINEMARNKPKVLYRTLGLDREVQREDFQSPLKSDQRSDSFAPRVQERTWAYYQELKKKDPKLYNDPKTNVQMQQDYIRLGDKFEDGDFHRV
jgi:hypothetical protein